MARILKNTIYHTPPEALIAGAEVTSGTLALQSQVGRFYTNIVQNLVDSANTFTSPVSASTRPGTLITPLTTIITTVRSNCKIKYELIMSLDCSHNNTFYLERVIGASVTEIGSGDTVAAPRTYGFATGFNDANIVSTMNQIIFKYIDSPGVAAGTQVEYRVRFYDSASASQILYLNRTQLDTDGAANGYERGSSVVTLTELPV